MHINQMMLVARLMLIGGMAWLTTVSQAQPVSIAARAGTLGPGIEVSVAVQRHLTARLGANYLAYSHTDLVRDYEVDITYDARMKLKSIVALLDWHPFTGGFLVSAGVSLNDNDISVVVNPIEDYVIDGKSFSPNRIGQLNGRITHGSKISPYMGIGHRHTIWHRLGYALDFGFFYTRSPKVYMTGTGMIAPTADQAADLEEGLKSFRFYPHFSLGLSLQP